MSNQQNEALTQHLEELKQENGYGIPTTNSVSGCPTPVYGLGAATGIAAKPARDNWQHRSEGMKCKTCMWYVEKKFLGLQHLDKSSFGRCRKNCPTMNGFPAVYGNDWCGDHKIDENKI